MCYSVIMVLGELDATYMHIWASRSCRFSMNLDIIVTEMLVRMYQIFLARESPLRMHVPTRKRRKDTS